ncbi:MAG: acetyltransferase [Cystobacterineae bacterium]|nr:acetyltransferase [Cystobacterineae bacterium]
MSSSLAAPPPQGRWLSRWKLRRCTRVGHGTRVLGKIWVHGRGKIYVGDHVFFDARNAPIELHAKTHATLYIGNGCLIEGGSSLEAVDSISLGENCHLGPFVKLMDNHQHQTTGNRQERPSSNPIVLEQNVKVGAHSILLPGAQLGEGTLLEAHTVVSRKIPAGAHLQGNPPRALKKEPKKETPT